LINDAQRKCLGCGKPISRVWFKGYCNVECVPDNVEIPRMILQSEAVRIDRAKCRIPLTEIEVRDLLAHLRSQAVGSDYDRPVGLVRKEKLDLHRAMAGGKFAGAEEPMPFVNLTPGDIIENLLVLLTEAENDYNNLVQDVNDNRLRREFTRRKNLLQGGAR
jgi:hypothetical protein